MQKKETIKDMTEVLDSLNRIEKTVHQSVQDLKMLHRSNMKRLSTIEIKREMDIAGVTQAQIARNMNTSRQYVQQVINRDISSIDIEAAIAKAIGKKHKEIFEPIIKKGEL